MNASDPSVTIPSAIDQLKFERGKLENPRYWSRFRERPSLQGLSVLEIGCGYGSLCVEAAHAGAKRVVGIDLRHSAITFAKAHVKSAYPALADRIEFHAVYLQDYPIEQFDCILSKDTFEHIIDLESMLAEMKKRLKPGGRIYSGFGPLYPSPYGDHDRRRMLLRHWGPFGRSLAIVPWAHLLLEDALVRLNNKHEKKQARSLRDMGLNMLGVSDYERIINASGLHVLHFDCNRGVGLSPKLFSALRKLPPLKNLCTYNVYCVLENPR